MGLGVSHQSSVISYQSSVSAFFSLLPAPISPRNAHELVSPLPFSPLPAPISLLQKNIKFY
ncbi:unknown protein [Microcystis aeruginosa NIES-843]|uniref:Uncharacterized protein n=1 Tax=Microcystis aeruginosa (strain NIES-843 / IAM M-2473) TaxID=449447 RepID=B0JHS4_MICAN|nr:unknown protein [Microcystis aeruginosa NIES-843]